MEHRAGNDRTDGTSGRPAVVSDREFWPRYREVIASVARD